MNFIIVTGMSGAGKSTVLKIFEDLGFYCADNLPPSLIPNFASLCLRQDIGIENVAVGVDIRGGKLFDDINAALAQLANKKANIKTDILFLESENDVLLTRYKESRRTHPLAKEGDITGGITRERQLLSDFKQRATHIINTSYMRTRQLKEKLVEIFIKGEIFDNLMINVISFGFKYGLPREADLVFDVRFIPNPFYIPDLKPLCGLDEPVRDYVLGSPISVQFLKSLESMIHFLIPHYTAEGKSHLVIGVGCTGGRHRSVTIAEALCVALDKSKCSVTINHRDVEKDTAL